MIDSKPCAPPPLTSLALEPIERSIASPSTPPRGQLLFPPESRVAKALALLVEIERIAPAVAAWLSEPRSSRGPLPICDARTTELLEEIRELYAAQ